jgi:hypothetical protein
MLVIPQKAILQLLELSSEHVPITQEYVSTILEDW